MPSPAPPQTPAAAGPQDVAAAAPPAEAPSWFWDFCQQPGVLETVLILLVAGAALFVWWRLARLVSRARARAALEDYLLGVEQALQGDLTGAQRRLAAVLEQDPENHYARLLLGKVLAEQGRAEEAHQQHLYLKKAFAVDSAENELLLAQSLLDAGLPAEAADVAQRALERMPHHAAGSLSGWEFVYRARLRCGDHEAAAAAGRRMLLIAGDDARGEDLRPDVARTLAAVATERWQAGDRAGARELCKQAERTHEGVRQLPLLLARLDAGEHGVESVARRLSAPASDNALAIVEPALPVVGRTAGTGALPMATFQGLLEPSRWLCRACAHPLPRDVVACPRCGAGGSSQLGEPALVAELPSPGEVMDRIDVSPAHVQRLVQALAAGDSGVRGELLDIGGPAVEELLRLAWRSQGPGRDAAIDALRAMGPEVTPALFAACDQLTRQRLLPGLLPVGEGPEVVVGRIVQSFDRSATPHLSELFGSKRPEHRRILIDYFLGLGDVDAFQQVLEKFPPVEILHRLNHADAAVLRQFLGAIPRGHFLVESLLLEKTFYRDEALLAAVPDAVDGEVLVQVMLRRGPSRTLATALIAAIADERLAATAQRVLEELGEVVLEHVLAAYADPDCSESVQQSLERVLVRGGGAAATHIVDEFGPEPTALDDRLRRLLVIIGDDAVGPMSISYERSGWLEKVSGGLLRSQERHNNRRVQVASALGELGTRAAIRILKTLHKREKDDNLRIHLARALHTAEGQS